jgi:hypothetical protein
MRIEICEAAGGLLFSGKSMLADRLPDVSGDGDDVEQTQSPQSGIFPKSSFLDEDSFDDETALEQVDTEWALLLVG